MPSLGKFILFVFTLWTSAYVLMSWMEKDPSGYTVFGSMAFAFGTTVFYAIATGVLTDDKEVKKVDEHTSRVHSGPSRPEMPHNE